MKSFNEPSSNGIKDIENESNELVLNSKDIENKEPGSSVSQEIKVDAQCFESGQIQIVEEQQSCDNIELESDTSEQSYHLIVEENEDDKAYQFAGLPEISEIELTRKLKEFQKNHPQLSNKMESALTCFENFIWKIKSKTPRYNATNLADLLYFFLKENESMDCLLMMTENALGSSTRSENSLKVFLKVLADRLIPDGYEETYIKLLEYCSKRYVVREGDNLRNPQIAQYIRENRRGVLLEACKAISNEEERNRVTEMFPKNVYNYLPPGKALEHFIYHANQIKELTKKKLYEIGIYIDKNNTISEVSKINYTPKILSFFWKKNQEFIISDARDFEDIENLILPLIDGVKMNYNFVKKFLKAIYKDEIIKNQIDQKNILKTQLQEISDRISVLELELQGCSATEDSQLYKERSGYKEGLNAIKKTLQELISQNRELSKEANQHEIQMTKSSESQIIISILNDFQNSGKVLSNGTTKTLNYIKDRLENNVISSRGYTGTAMAAFLGEFLSNETDDELVWIAVGKILVSCSFHTCKSLKDALENLPDYMNPDINKDPAVRDKIHKKLLLLLEASYSYLKNDKPENKKTRDTKSSRVSMIRACCKNLAEFSSDVKALMDDYENTKCLQEEVLPSITKESGDNSFDVANQIELNPPVEKTVDPNVLSKAQCEDQENLLNQFPLQREEGNLQLLEEDTQEEVAIFNEAPISKRKSLALSEEIVDPAFSNNSLILRMQGRKIRFKQSENFIREEENPPQDEKKNLQIETSCDEGTLVNPSRNNSLAFFASQSERPSPEVTQPAQTRLLKSKIEKYRGSVKRKPEECVEEGLTNKGNAEKRVFLGGLNNFKVTIYNKSLEESVPVSQQCFRYTFQQFNLFGKNLLGKRGFQYNGGHEVKHLEEEVCEEEQGNSQCQDQKYDIGKKLKK